MRRPETRKNGPEPVPGAPSHIGWGHSRLGDVLAFARLTEAQHVLLFHHDPLDDDEQLDRLHAEARARWAAAGRSPHEVLMATELQELALDGAGAGVAATASPTAASLLGAMKERPVNSDAPQRSSTVFHSARGSVSESATSGLRQITSA